MPRIIQSRIAVPGPQGPGVPAEVSQAVATAAIDAAVQGRDILEGGNILEDDIAFAVVDTDGRRTWLEADIAGRPTSRAATLIGAPAAMDTDLTGLAFAVVDETGRRTWLETDAAGRPTRRAVRLIAEAMGLGLTQIVSGPAIACSGDSLTAGAGGGSTTYPTALATLSGRLVYNLGVGGETSATIAGRTGGRPWLASVAGSTIPASGGVTVTLAGDDGSSVAPLLQGDAGVNPVQIAGIEGTLSLASSVYTFARSVAGSAVPVNVPVPVSTAAMRTNRGDITILWWGQNDGSSDAITNAVIARERATIEALRALDKRWLVISPPTGTAASRATQDALYLAAYGRRVINIRAYLATTAALADATITPTAQDTTDISAGTVPTSLRSDAVHLNAAGYTLVAQQVFNRLTEMGWL